MIRMPTRTMTTRTATTAVMMPRVSIRSGKAAMTNDIAMRMNARATAAYTSGPLIMTREPAYKLKIRCTALARP